MKYDNIQKKRKEEKMGEKIMDCGVRLAPPLLGRVSDRTSRKASRRVEKKCIECLAVDVQRYLNLSLSKKKESAEGGDRTISSLSTECSDATLRPQSADFVQNDKEDFLVRILLAGHLSRFSPTQRR